MRECQSFVGIRVLEYMYFQFNYHGKYFFNRLIIKNFYQRIVHMSLFCFQLILCRLQNQSDIIYIYRTKIYYILTIYRYREVYVYVNLFNLSFFSLFFSFSLLDIIKK